MAQQHGTYYVPSSSQWPVLASFSLFVMLWGVANWLHKLWYGPYVTSIGLIMLLMVIWGWFGDVIHESQAGLYDDQMDRTYRWSMGWFIFSEVCFFAAFFGALFYARIISVPTLGGVGYGANELTHMLLWPDFKAVWPLLSNPDNTTYPGAYAVMHTWGIPALNTLILLTSGATITWAHHALRANHRKQLIIAMILTVLLGIIFLGFQAYEYAEAIAQYGLSLGSGIYGATFFMLTGFHGAHVTLGTIMLIVITIRCIKGHFTPSDHFAFEAVAWYWHFVDVVWLFLFIFVYWL